MKTTDELIADLAGNAAPVAPAAGPLLTACGWLLACALYAAAMVAYVGVRPDLSVALHRPLFAAEIALLGCIIAGCALSAAALSFPDMHQRRWLARLPLAAFAGFILVMALAWRADNPPAPPPAHHLLCTFCIMLYALLPGGFMLYRMHRLASTHARLAGMAAALSAFAVGALILRLNEPTDSIAHIVTMHYLPMVAVALLGLGLGKCFLKW